MRNSSGLDRRVVGLISIPAPQARVCALLNKSINTLFKWVFNVFLLFDLHS